MALTNFTSIDADEHPLKINNSIEFKCLAEIEADKAIHRVVIEIFLLFFLFYLFNKFFCLFIFLHKLYRMFRMQLVHDENK